MDCGKTDNVTVELRSGHAEIFGTELVANTKYTFTNGDKFAIFTYRGCTIMVSINQSELSNDIFDQSEHSYKITDQSELCIHSTYHSRCRGGWR